MNKKLVLLFIIFSFLILFFPNHKYAYCANIIEINFYQEDETDDPMGEFYYKNINTKVGEDLHKFNVVEDIKILNNMGYISNVKVSFDFISKNTVKVNFWINDTNKILRNVNLSEDFNIFNKMPFKLSQKKDTYYNKLKEILSQFSGEYFNKKNIGSLINAVRNFFLDNHFNAPIILLKYANIQNSPDEVDVFLDIVNCDHKKLISKISFNSAHSDKSNLFFSTRELYDMIKNYYDNSILGYVLDKISPDYGIYYDEELISFLKDIILKSYINKGFLDASIKVKIVNNKKDKYSVNCIFVIDKGNRFLFNDFIITEDSEISNVKKSKVYNMLKTLSNKEFDKVILDNKISSVIDKFMSTGYADIEHSYVYKYNVNKNAKVDIYLTIKLGKKYYINDVNINSDIGSSLTRPLDFTDSLMRRDIKIQPYDLFNIKKINKSLNNLIKSGYYDKVSYAINDAKENYIQFDDYNNYKDVTYYVSRINKRSSLLDSFRIGWNHKEGHTSIQGIYDNFDFWGLNNFFIGGGQIISLNILLPTKIFHTDEGEEEYKRDQDYVGKISFLNKKLFGKNLHFGVDVSLHDNLYTIDRKTKLQQEIIKDSSEDKKINIYTKSISSDFSLTNFSSLFNSDNIVFKNLMDSIKISYECGITNGSVKKEKDAIFSRIIDLHEEKKPEDDKEIEVINVKQGNKCVLNKNSLGKCKLSTNEYKSGLKISFNNNNFKQDDYFTTGYRFDVGYDWYSKKILSSRDYYRSYFIFELFKPIKNIINIHTFLKVLNSSGKNDIINDYNAWSPFGQDYIRKESIVSGFSTYSTSSRGFRGKLANHSEAFEEDNRYKSALVGSIELEHIMPVDFAKGIIFIDGAKLWKENFRQETVKYSPQLQVGYCITFDLKVFVLEIGLRGYRKYSNAQHKSSFIVFEPYFEIRNYL